MGFIIYVQRIVKVIYFDKKKKQSRSNLKQNESKFGMCHPIPGFPIGILLKQPVLIKNNKAFAVLFDVLTIITLLSSDFVIAAYEGLQTEDSNATP